MSLSWKLLHTRIKNIFGVLIQQKAKPQLKKKKKPAQTYVHSHGKMPKK